MVEIINNIKLVKARKDYRDSNREFIMEFWNDEQRKQFTEEEVKMVEQAIENKWLIKRGDMHEHGVFKNDGEIYSLRSHPGLTTFCSKHDLYPED